jgi:N4-gp56 family major capsid protein
MGHGGLEGRSAPAVHEPIHGDVEGFDDSPYYRADGFREGDPCSHHHGAGPGRGWCRRDNQLEGNEEEIKAFDRVIQIDQIRNANRNKGRLADQKTVVRFRENSRDVLAHWISDILDQIAFLTLSGEAYSLRPDGTTRVGSQLPLLEFAGDVTAPSAARHRNWEGSPAALAAANTASTTLALPSWAMMVRAKAYAKMQRIRPIRGLLGSGTESYVCLMHTEGMAHLKLDTDFLKVMSDAHRRGGMRDHPLMAGAEAYYVDGIMIIEHEHVFHPNTWGAGSVHGQAVIFAGAQALGYADIGAPNWVEKGFDYENQQGIAIDKICGFLKPQFPSAVTGANEDFGVLRINTRRN